MAEYQPIVTATVEAYQLGAGSPPAWYAPLVAAKDVIPSPQDTLRYTVLTTDRGPVPALAGDYLIYEAGVTLRVMAEAAFEAAYEEVVE